MQTDASAFEGMTFKIPFQRYEGIPTAVAGKQSGTSSRSRTHPWKGGARGEEGEGQPLRGTAAKTTTNHAEIGLPAKTGGGTTGIAVPKRRRTPADTGEAGTGCGWAEQGHSAHCAPVGTAGC